MAANGPHPSHVTRMAMDASSYDEKCINCGATDEVPGGWGQLANPCHRPVGSGGLTLQQYYEQEKRLTAAAALPPKP